MKKNFLIDSGIIFFYLFAACLMNMFVTSIAIKIIDSFVFLEYFPLSVVKMSFSLVVVSGILGTVTYLLSYRKAEFSVDGFAARFCVGAAVQLALSVLFKFHTFISGGVKYLAGAFEHGGDLAADNWDLVGIFDYLIAFAIFFAIYLAVAIICGKVAVKNRLRDREELTGRA